MQKLKYTAITILTLLLAAAVLLVAYSFYVSKPLFDESRQAQTPKIAPRNKALTFARTPDSLLLVVDHMDSGLIGIDLTARFGEEATADVIELYHRQGYQALATLEGPRVPVPLFSLIKPYEYKTPHIAVGTNYAEHAEEVYLDDPPFLFPKLSQATRWDAPVGLAARLDYEAELCMVPLSDIKAPEQAVEFGLVLCNDFTDRWRLISRIDLGEPMGTTGFAAGKGQPGFLPTGYLFVIPAEDGFHRDIEMSLYVNDRKRQDFSTGDMILGVEEVVRQSFALADRDFHHGDRVISLLPQGTIPRGTLLLTGTAAGVIFKPVNVWYSGFYLQPGDVVVTRGEYLGTLENRVEIR